MMKVLHISGSETYLKSDFDRKIQGNKELVGFWKMKGIVRPVYENFWFDKNWKTMLSS